MSEEIQLNERQELLNKILTQDPELQKESGFYTARLKPILQQLIGVLSTYTLHPITIAGIDGSVNLRQLSAYEEEIVIDNMIQDYIRDNILSPKDQELGTVNAHLYNNKKDYKAGSKEYSDLFNTYYKGTIGAVLHKCATLSLASTLSVQDNTKPRFTMDFLFLHIGTPLLKSIWREYLKLLDMWSLSIGEENLDETIAIYTNELCRIFINEEGLSEDDVAKKQLALLSGTHSYTTSAIAIALFHQWISQEVIIQDLKSSAGFQD